LKDFKEESRRVNRELRTLKLLEAQGIASATGPEKVEYVKSITTKMVDFLLNQETGTPASKQADEAAQADVLKRKKEFMRQSITQGKKFGSLSEILQAVGKSLNQSEED
jgi:hypothetical protein